MVNQNKMHFLLGFNSNAPSGSPDEHKEKNVPKRKRFSKKTTSLFSVVLIAVIVVSCFAFYPSQPLDDNPQDGNPDPSSNPTSTPSDSSTPDPQTSTTPDPTATPTKKPSVPSDNSWKIVTNANGRNLTSSDWKEIATIAWAYFDQNINSTTGLPGSSDSYEAFTDWDLGVYIQAIIDAQTIGLIGTDGTGGSSARIDKILWFLENRELNSTTGYPYWFYKTDGTNYHEDSDTATAKVDVADTGRLFVALNNLKSFNSSLATRIDNFVYNVYGNRSDYASLVPSIKSESNSNSIYAYYCLSGFASFWPTQLSSVPSTILNNILSGDAITYGNVILPESKLLTEPLLCAFFEIDNPSNDLYTLVDKVYGAHETYYDITGQYRAFSEGPSSGIDWIYEWVVYYDNLWVVQVNGENSDMTPIIYTKTAFSFLAIYDTVYTRSMATYLEAILNVPTCGYCNGATESGSTLYGASLHTNGLILDAARYAIANNF